MLMNANVCGKLDNTHLRIHMITVTVHEQGLGLNYLMGGKKCFTAILATLQKQIHIYTCTLTKLFSTLSLYICRPMSNYRLNILLLTVLYIFTLHKLVWLQGIIVITPEVVYTSLHIISILIIVVILHACKLLRLQHL